MRQSTFWVRRGLVVLVSGIAVAGCAGAVGGGLSSLVGVVILVLGLVACSTDSAPGATGLIMDTVGDAGGETVAPEPDGFADVADAGEWQSCCVAGVVTECFCEANAICNYGWYTACGDGSCVDPGQSCGDADVAEDSPDVPDVPSDTPLDQCLAEGGEWSACCVQGEIGQCCCPAGTECNYGWYTDCGGGTCIDGPEAQCPDADVQEPDAQAPDVDVSDVSEPADAGDACLADGGVWEACCIDGLVEQCCCTTPGICNYGLFTDCGGGTCGYGECPDTDVSEPDVNEPDVHEPDVNEPDVNEPVDAGAPDVSVDAGTSEPDVNVPDKDTGESCDGFWETCCLDGHISTCCCPQGWACNYGWFDTCSDGSCTFPGGTCPEEQ